MIDRRRFLSTSAVLAAGASLPHVAAAAAPAQAKPLRFSDSEEDLTVADLACAERVQGLEFSEAAREMMLPDVQGRLAQLATIREAGIPNELQPALTLDLSLARAPRPAPGHGLHFEPAMVRVRPSKDEDLAFAGVAHLAGMLRGGAISSVELTRFYLNRLRRLDETLLAVVTLTEERALAQAERMDAELARGMDRGPLHGIPYGAKDLLAVAGYPTTWGTEPFRDQVIERDAEIIRRLDDAGAVLVAKLTLGELAWGDVWFGGMTRNPWNPDQGSSGSSAGPGAAVAAGMVPFAIGSETYGSIVSPSHRTGVTGFRPTFDRVPTRGAMALSWSMDKLGPMARSARDAALVFDAIRGADHPLDHPDPNFPFDPHSNLDELRVGYLPDAFERGEGAAGDADRAILEVVRRLGVDLRPASLPDDVPVGALLIILQAEASAAFDELTRSSGLDAMARQERFSWPNVFRHARHIPAVEYINANRLRTRLMQRMTELFADLDVLLTPTYGNDALAITNLTGHPAVAIPAGFFPVEGHPERRSPHSIMMMGPLWQDHLPLRLAHAVQQVTDFHERVPPIS
jgi:Asp-tRNA(Asn)/Glu-tRNA(Gln) amidotransferase A subunit family amidase